MNHKTSETTVQALKGMIPARLQTDRSHVFTVHHQLRFLEDAQRNLPEFRKEVMEGLPTFAAGSGRHVIPYAAPSSVVRRLRPYTSLVRRFSALAFKEIDDLEAMLTLDDSLTAQQRSRHHKRLQALTSGMHPVWENWIVSLDPRQYNIIDRQVRDWLDEPLDWDEIELFRDDWEDLLYSAKAAKQLFDQLPSAVLSFMGIELGDFVQKFDDKALSLYVLPGSVSNASACARELGLKWSFKVFKP